MFALQFQRFGGPEVLQVGEAAEPHPGAGEIRVRVHAGGISPVDLGLRAGTTPMSRRLALPHIPGVDAAGVVDEVGPDVTGVAIGDEVFGIVNVARLGGAHAEFAVLQFWAPKPALMPWTEAGAAASSVETATRALDLLDLRDGMTIVIDGAAGGVGSVAVQLAAARGAHVIGTARAGNHEFVTGLGARPTTYGPGLGGRISGTKVDRALDVAGGGGLADLIDITGDPGHVVTLADFTAAQHGARITTGRLGGEPDGSHGLVVAADLFAEGRFRMPIEAVFPLADGAAAHAAAGQGSRQGKIVLAS
ncbi:NADP-dependent oxidoreductase [Asanoa ferruginea]|uniref:NADP-dependent oxidoreductase n=1 Tax=Asanoa ferruginea TaxID=53367 RepID=UPI000E27BA6B|nr:NADP-dependent oxidoreductase [Asanoa ferruginea]